MQYGSCCGNTGEAANLNTKVKKMAASQFALSNQNIVEQLKENAKNIIFLIGSNKKCEHIGNH